MLEEGISLRLQTFNETQAIVGDRVFPLVLPSEEDLPALVFQGISVSPVLGVSGQNALTKRRLQVDCYGKQYADVKTLERAVNHALVNFQGALADGDVTYVDSIYLNNAVDLFESDANQYRVMLDFDVWFIAT
jgi:hypothetical protein